jgi:hypothetical protein
VTLRAALLLLRVVGVAVVAFAVMVPSPASALTEEQAAAKSFADSLVTSLMPNATTPSSVCAVTHSTFFAHRRSYLGSCAAASGAFKLFLIANASKQTTIDTSSQFAIDQLDQLCKSGGAVYSAAVPKQFVAFFMGTGAPDQAGSGAAVALQLRNQFGSQMSAQPGYAASTATCVNGKVKTTR